MIKRTVMTGVVVVCVLFGLSHSVAQTGEHAARVAEQDVMNLSIEVTGYSVKKVWEGEIDEKHTAYLKAEKGEKVVGIVVTIQDEYPKFLKRIEYIDEGADTKLDLVRMKVYKAAQGWKDIGITKDNKYGLEFAGIKYNEVLEKIMKELQEEKK